MSITMFLIFDAILLVAIGFFIWVYVRGSRMSSLEMVASYKINLRDTESKIQLAVEERIARVDLNEKRLNYLESRVGRLSGRSEKTVIKLAEKEIARRKREKFGKGREAVPGIISRNEAQKMMNSDFESVAREVFERKMIDQRMKLYAGLNV